MKLGVFAVLFGNKPFEDVLDYVKAECCAGLDEAGAAAA